jgi:hypothetical protein
MKDELHSLLDAYKYHDWLNGMYWSDSHDCVRPLEWWISYYDTLDTEETFFDFRTTFLTPVREATEEEKAKELPKDTGFLMIMGDNGQSECWMEV